MGTEDVGICVAGVETCDGDGTWGACADQVMPGTEDCAAVGDEDCDGIGCSEPIWGLFGERISQVEDIVIDSAGNAIVSVTITEAFTFGTTTFTPSVQDAVLMKIDPTGEILWVKQLGGGGSDGQFHVAITADDSIVVAGRFAQSLDLGNGVSVSTATQDVFVAELATDGTAQWATQLGADNPDPTGGKAVAGVAVAPSGRIVVVGTNSGHWGGCNPCTAADQTDAFVRIFDENGTQLFERERRETGFELPSDVAVAPDGTIAIVGQYTLGLDLGGPATEAGNDTLHAFIAKLNADGVGSWSADLEPGGTAGSRGRAVQVLSDGTVVVGGYFSASITLDATLTGADDIYVGAFSADGTPTWSKHLVNGDGGTNELNAMGIDADDNIVVTGAFYETLDFDGQALTAPAATNGMYLVKMGADGSHIWSRTVTSDHTYVNAEGMGVHTDGRVVAGGIFNGVIDYGQGPVDGGMDTPRAFYVAGFQP